MTNALTKPKKFSVVFRKKSFGIVNIIFYLSQEYPKGGHFPIPVKLIATRAHATPEFVYALIDKLKKIGFIKVVNENYKPNVIGRLYVWLAEPVN